MNRILAAAQDRRLYGNGERNFSTVHDWDTVHSEFAAFAFAGRPLI
ncbi:hypothetical protein [Mesorhizobium caraganae]